MTRSLSSKIEETQRGRFGETARILPPEIREALNVLEVEIARPNSKYNENMHTHIIKKLVQPSIYRDAQPGHQLLPETWEPPKPEPKPAPKVVKIQEPKAPRAVAQPAPAPKPSFNWMPLLVLALALATVADKWL